MKDYIRGNVSNVNLEITQVVPIGLHSRFFFGSDQPQHKAILTVEILVHEVTGNTGDAETFKRQVADDVRELVGERGQHRPNASYLERRVQELTRANEALQEKLRQADAKATAQASVNTSVIDERDKLQGFIDKFDDAMQTMHCNSTRVKARRAEFNARRSPRFPGHI